MIIKPFESYLEGIVTKIFFSIEGADAVYRVMNSAKPM
nr:hypothetical protein [Mucilaginibacter sp. SP1R1]